MKRFKSLLVGGVAIAGLTVSLLIHGQARLKLSEDARLLQQDQIQLAELVAEHERLSNQLALANKHAPNPAAELAALRKRVEALRQQASELAHRAQQIPARGDPQNRPRA